MLIRKRQRRFYGDAQFDRALGDELIGAECKICADDDAVVRLIFPQNSFDLFFYFFL